VFPDHAVKAHGGIEVQLHSFLTSALDGGEWSTSRLGRFTPGKECQYPSSRRLGGSQGRSGQFTEEKNQLPFPRFETVDCPTGSLVSLPNTLSRPPI
jgi:hypothetical protein